MGMARQARKHKLGPLHPAFNLLQMVLDALQRSLPEDAHVRASGRLCVSLTRVPDGKNVLVSEFDSREELIQVYFTVWEDKYWSNSSVAAVFFFLPSYENNRACCLDRQYFLSALIINLIFCSGSIISLFVMSAEEVRPSITYIQLYCMCFFQTLLCSCFVPFYCGVVPPTYRGLVSKLANWYT